ncbi:MAG: ribosome small subunit-dependent GTPase A [Candidatus Aminicenantes bacterium]
MNNDKHKITLEDMGYSDFFRNKRIAVKDKNLIPARIIAEHKESYILRNELSEYSAKITGKMMFAASSREDYPAVGDWVLITPLDKEQAVIHQILPRRTVLKRKSAGKKEIQIIASNIDVAFIVQSPDRDYSLNRFERYFSQAESGRIKPAVVLNKIDLIDESDLEWKISEIKDRFKEIDIYTTSTVTGKGIADLNKNIKKGLAYCFLGSSGVGKSSIINRITGKNLIRTEKISSHTNRGRHITVHRQLFILKNGGLLIDNPGMREIGMLDSKTGIKNVFSEIQELSKNCRFSDCTHTHEPGCAVLKAIKSGDLDKSKYENYIKLVKENEFNTMTRLEKRRKDREFGKFIKKAKKQIKK